MTLKLDGRIVAKRIKDTISNQIKQLPKALKPSLTVVQVGHDAASDVYVKNKEKACEQVGMTSQILHLPTETSQQTLLNTVKELNANPLVNGIIVQLPLPNHINSDVILDAIAPEKDVDGFHPFNIGLLAQSRPNFRSCTPYGIMLLLEHYKIDLCGKHVVVVGASNIVGRPMLLEALNAKATVTICHSKTTQLSHLCQQGDIIIMATGHQDLLGINDVKPDAILIDVGIHRLKDGRLRGDLNYEELSQHVKAMTPVPGGVGPLTVACLIQNTYTAFIQQNQLPPLLDKQSFL